MLEEITTRQQRHGLSTRKLSIQLDVSPSLLSPVLNGRRGISTNLCIKLRRWLNKPIATGGYDQPNTVYKAFIAERASFVSAETIRYYREKLEPFILWCEKGEHIDITIVSQSVIAEFLAFVRKGRRNHGNFSDSKRENHTTRLVRLIRNSSELWHTPDRRPYASMPFGDGSIHNLSIRSSEFRYKVAAGYQEHTKLIPPQQALKDAAEILSGAAVINGKEHETFTRVARVGQDIYVDLCDEKWRVVKITDFGWDVISNPPVKFVRSPGMRPLPSPETGGDLAKLRELLPRITHEDWIKIQGFLLGAFNPEGTA